MTTKLCVAAKIDGQCLRMVATKTADQLDLQAPHRVRARLVSQRTGIINQIRAFLLERGIAVRQGLHFMRAELPSVLAKRTDVLSPRMLRISRIWPVISHAFRSRAMLQLYGNPRSRAMPCLWMLEEMGEPCQLIEKSTRADELQNAEYLLLNPNARIPTLVDGNVVGLPFSRGSDWLSNISLILLIMLISAANIDKVFQVFGTRHSRSGSPYMTPI
jgi:hypothetical protein